MTQSPDCFRYILYRFPIGVGPGRGTSNYPLTEVKGHRLKTSQDDITLFHQKLWGPRSVSCDRAIGYSGFFGVSSVGPVGDFLELFYPFD